MDTDNNNKKRNLGNIKRIDQFADELIDHCSHSALFHFSSLERKWLKTETDGPLFIYKRLNRPLYSLMIANRQSLEDYIESITEGIHLKYEPPYIFIHREDGQIRAVWMYGEEDCRRIFNTMLLLRNSLKKEPNLNGMTMTTSTPRQLKNVSVVNENVHAVKKNMTAEAVKKNMTAELMKEVVGMAMAEDPLRRLQKQLDRELQQTLQQQQQTPVTTKTAIQPSGGSNSSEVPMMTMKENAPTSPIKNTPAEKEFLREKEVDATPTTAVTTSSAETTRISSPGDQESPNMMNSSFPCQDSGMLLRPVTFGDLERMKEELKEELMEGFRRELEKFRLHLSGPAGFGQL